MGIPRWVLRSAVVTLLTAGITVALLLHAGKDDNPFKQLDGLMTKPEARSVVGPPDGVEVLKRAECWSYGRRAGITEAKLCFGERGRLAWWSWGETGR